jgi:hypothetical protein
MTTSVPRYGVAVAASGGGVVVAASGGGVVVAASGGGVGVALGVLAGGTSFRKLVRFGSVPAKARILS